MRPFLDGKATRKPPKDRDKLNPDGRLMRRFERQGKERIAAALDRLRRRLFRGINKDNVQDMVSRLSDPKVIGPFKDDITTLVNEWAGAGADFGREQIERHILGTAKQVGINWDLANNAAAEWANRYAGELANGMTDVTRRRMQQEIAAFIESGDLTINQLGQRLESLFSPTRAEMVAVTEVTRAYAEGNMASWRESGVTEGKEWRTNVDELVCPICRPLDNNVVPLDQQFDGGHDGPPAHVRCRCWIVPVPIMDEGEATDTSGERQPDIQPGDFDPVVAKANVETYLDTDLGDTKLRVLDVDEFDRRFGAPGDQLHGGIAAIRLPDGRIFIKRGFESDAVHELVHASGALEDGVGTFLNEGITQSAAERIGSKFNMAVRSTYDKETNFVNRYIVPVVDESPEEFYRGYMGATDKGEFIVDRIWSAQGDKFSDVLDWGSDPRASLLRNLPNTIGTDLHLSYLVDELGVGR
jgi:SPP1 gp7 family putative phage head morphogenesis protein